MSTLTYADTLGKHNIALPDDLIAGVEVPVITGAQCQGDVGIWPRPAVGKAELTQMTKVPAAGVDVVKGTNTHILDAYHGDVFWQPHTTFRGDLTVGVLHVPDGSVAVLTHTDEHTSNGIGPGTYELTGKREQAEEIRRVAD
jgi:hypothetical protein